MRKRNGMFCVFLEENCEFQVKEENLLNEAIYKIIGKKFHVSSQEREMFNRRVKHELKGVKKKLHSHVNRRQLLQERI